MSYDKITAVINTFNSEDIINQCLNSLDSKVRAIIIENSNNESFKKEIEKKYLNEPSLENLIFPSINYKAYKELNEK